jgi:sialic acid synthase SpsE
MNSIRLGSREISSTSLPYVIAEIGVNHEGSLDLAKRLIELAKEGGADAAKFQTYKAAKLASRNSPAYWDLSQEPTESQFALFGKLDGFGDEEYLALEEHCRIVGIDFLSTPFDLEAVEFLDPLMPFYKIASADITNVPLLRRTAAKSKPVLLSTGASTIEEIQTAAETLESHGASSIILLHCILNYPCPAEHAHINMIEGLGSAFPGKMIGYSDHTRPDPAMAILTAAVLKGARVIEKHFTHDKTLTGNDHYHAMDVDDLKIFVENMKLLKIAGGEKDKNYIPSEEISRQNARRSIVVARPLKAGDEITEFDIICKRPGFGISPLHWDEVIGKQVNKNLADDDILDWADLTEQAP